MMSKEKVDYPLEIMKDRERLINKEISDKGEISTYNYNLLL